MQPDLTLKNLARGGKPYHDHRRAIARALLERDLGVGDLSNFLRDKLFVVRSGWRAFAFAQKDREIADRMLVQRRPEVDHRMLEIALAYIGANAASVAHLYALGDMITGQILTTQRVLISVPTESLTPEEWQSRFGFKILCATNEQSPKEMHGALESAMALNEWCRSRLMYPMINQTVNRTPPDAIDSFLDYFMSGGERSSEKAALKLLLHYDAARSTPLAFKIFIGTMGHPFNACEILLDHLEFSLAKDGALDPTPLRALEQLSALFPGSRASDLAALAGGDVVPEHPTEAFQGLTRRLDRYGLGEEENALLSTFATLKRFAYHSDSASTRPLETLAAMRASTYPAPEQFRDMMVWTSVWGFVDGGRLLGALMRSLYMIDRTGHELEGRDVLRLISLYGQVNEFIATAPSAIPVLRRVMPSIVASHTELRSLEGRAQEALDGVDPDQRLWINQLQWRLRALEEAGKVQRWLETVRLEAKLRPLYLTGINWPWVEEILAQQKLKGFRSFDGAYLLLIAEMESRNDPQRLKLVLDKLLRDQTAPQAVDSLIAEFGEFAPAFVARYLTTANLLTSGRAANHFAALNQRIEALETCIRRLGFNATLPREMYESETRVLTTELLLLNVNSGKFEVPWDLFASNAEEKHRDQWDTFGNLRHSASEEALSAYVDTPRLFRNGHKEEYRYRRNDALLFQLVVQLVEDFLDHPAFGLEIILSGRFRHNNLLQELHAAIAAVGSSTIHPVTPLSTKRLSAAYRRVVERALFQWCSRILQTRRKDKPEALFHLVPDSDEVNAIVRSADGRGDLREVVAIVIDWIKSRLRPQVEQAGKVFAQDMKRDFEVAFGRLLDEQVEACDNTYRPDDARRVHQAVLDAVLRRIDALQTWFDGVDTQSAAPVSLAQLAQATETLFENVLPDRELRTDADLEATATTFSPAEVKVAFDLVREVAFNALKHSSDPKVRLRVQRLAEPGPTIFVFSNPIGDGVDGGEVHGTRYVSEDEALRREGNSGRLKIAASAATLLGQDVADQWTKRDGCYELSVPMRAAAAGTAI